MALEPLPGASTRIREALARGEAPDDLCPAVAEFVRRRGLYAPTTAG
jgi:hypothetical protein